jgi:hypothetical protein
MGASLTMEPEVLKLPFITSAVAMKIALVA